MWTVNYPLNITLPGSYETQVQTCTKVLSLPAFLNFTQIHSS